MHILWLKLTVKKKILQSNKKQTKKQKTEQRETGRENG